MKSRLFIFFNSVLRPFQDYYSSYETGENGRSPRKKRPGTPASRTLLVLHVARAGLEPTPDTQVETSLLTAQPRGPLFKYLWKFVINTITEDNITVLA